MSESKTQGPDTAKAVAGAINKATGRVTVYDALTGEPSHVYPVDAKEIVASGCGLLTPPAPPQPAAESETDPNTDPNTDPDDTGNAGESGVDQDNDAGAEEAPEVHTLTVEGSTPSPATNPKKKPGPKPKAKPAAEGGA